MGGEDLMQAIEPGLAIGVVAWNASPHALDVLSVVVVVGIEKWNGQHGGADRTHGGLSGPGHAHHDDDRADRILAVQCRWGRGLCAPVLWVRHAVEARGIGLPHSGAGTDS